MNKNRAILPEQRLTAGGNVENIEQCIYFVRRCRIMLDEDLAMLYGVGTKVLNRAVKRNTERFPEDFMFQLSKNELEILKCQIGTARLWGGRRNLPYVFTEQGVAMLSGVLRSKQAINVNIQIMRAFVKLRHFLSSHEELAKGVDELKSFLLKHSQKTDQEFRKVWKAIEILTTPSAPQRKMGFDLGQ